ncbi:D-serine ammonia-lyase [Fredinandcohnia sp. 179-A 10B2 NHS]|uniref:D-serine ammonia-lyase n=1 Tax=Fredinandcohnia sp. 179-A 10B2 NHS TaxID=3235176 RepID=UPI0039A3DD66
MKKLKDVLKQYPILQEVIRQQPEFWKNPDYFSTPCFPVNGIEEEIIDVAAGRFNRSKDLIHSAFPETSNGEIVSPITEIPHMKVLLERQYQTEINGRLLLKRDDLLPVAGSIKARGGFHEVLAFAEKLGIENGLLKPNDEKNTILLSEEAKALFQKYTISVGSTGNLGLSIGMIGAKLGFKVVVHMSADAKEWKKELLKKHGVKVVEHQSDYSVAVEKAREEAARDKFTYFVDDENSNLLFAGYSHAAQEVREQLDSLGIPISKEQPLFVYIPCGVGGGPGGVTFGLKRVFGEHVHCFFAEPIQSPCMLVGLVTKMHQNVSVEDFNLTNQTEADGLAVGRPSGFVGKLMEQLLNGIYTIKDEELLRLLSLLYDSENIFLEPSALAGMKGPVLMDYYTPFKEAKKAIHLVWGTGGSLVPEQLRQQLIKRGRIV